MTNCKSTRSRQGGWNLIELLVVISIISILLAILVNVMPESRAQVEQTKVTLRDGIAAATEYEATTSQKVSHTAGPGTGSIGKFCVQLWRMEKSRTVLLSLGQDAVGPTPPTVLKDGWGRELQYYSGEGTTTESGMLSSKHPYLASAGPDGVWGTVNPVTNQRNADGALDNLYSLDLE